MVTTRIRLTLHKINTNFPQVYIYKINANSSGENNVHPRSRIFRVSYKLKAFHEAKLTSEPETDNEHDRFVVAGQTILPETLFPSTKSN